MGSAIQYASKNGVRYRYSYSPWGVRTHQVGGNTVFYQPGDDSPFGPFYRTYTGHEDLWMFGLINANARLYSPYLGRFISPDPLLNSEGGPLDYNPYIYARNNPYRYIDRNGEFPWLIAAFAAFATAGGVANVVSNWSDIHNFGEGLGFFCLGAGVTAATLTGAAVLGTAAACAAPYIAGVLGVAAESAVALGTAYAAAGAVYYVYEGCLNSAMNGTPFEFSWNGLAMTMATWGIPAGMEGYLLAKANGLNGWTGMGKSNVMATRHRPIVTGPDAMAAKAEAGKAITPSAEASGIAKETGIQARQSSAAMHSNAGLLERTGKSVTTFTGEVYISKSDPHYLELLKEAQARYPKKAGQMQWHHIDPIYMGGARNGKLIQIDAAYHQMITNEFRSHHAFGTRIMLEDAARRDIMQKVYMKYPLPQ